LSKAKAMPYKFPKQMWDILSTSLSAITSQISRPFHYQVPGFAIGGERFR
jgi:hypothetical protein